MSGKSHSRDSLPQNATSRLRPIPREKAIDLAEFRTLSENQLSRLSETLEERTESFARGGQFFSREEAEGVLAAIHRGLVWMQGLPAPDYDEALVSARNLLGQSANHDRIVANFLRKLRTAPNRNSGEPPRENILYTE